MSKKGEWKSGDGTVFQINQMEDRHLRNSILYIYRKLQTAPAVVGPTPPVNNSWRSKGSETYYIDKLVELAEEAQRRNWLPPNMLYEHLLTTLAGWERDKTATVQAHQQLSALRVAAINPATPIDIAVSRANRPPAVISMYTDVIGTMEGLIKPVVKKKNKKPEIVERNISFEL